MTSLSKVSPAADFVGGVRLADDFDISLVMTTIAALQHENDSLEKLHRDLLEVASKERKNRQRRDRRASGSSTPGATTTSCCPTWAEVCDETRDNLFRSKFRLMNPSMKEGKNNNNEDECHQKGVVHGFDVSGEQESAFKSNES